MDDEEKILLGQIPKPKYQGLRAKSVGMIVDRLLQQRGYANEQSTQLIQEQWEIAVGPTLASHCKVGRVVRGVLQVHAPNQMVMMELQLKKGVALKHLKQSLPSMEINDIRVRMAR